MPTENQPELAIAALQSEQAADCLNVAPRGSGDRGRSRQPSTATLQPFCTESLGGSRRPRPAVAHLRVRLSAAATYTVRLVHIQSDICDIAHSACHSCMRLCAAHPAQPSTLYMLRGGSPITGQTSGPDDRYGAGELMVTLAPRSTAAGPVTLGSRQHSPRDTRGS
jgi:hypothetical protein